MTTAPRHSTVRKAVNPDSSVALPTTATRPSVIATAPSSMTSPSSLIGTT